MEGISDERLIAVGGSSSVYRAKQTDLDREVAVKVLHAGSPPIRRRFDKERKALGRLSEHRGVLTVYGSGYTDDGKPYLITPYIPGGTLQDRIESSGPIPWSEACWIIASAAEAIQAGHDMGVVHRDIKPSNILIDSSGSPVVADFGIAHLVDMSHGLTVGATFTPNYAAPESLSGSEVSKSVDVYGLGATLFALIEGRPPFSTDSNDLVELADRISLEPAPRVNESVPAEVAEMIGSCLAKAPADRPPSAQSLVAELNRHLENGSTVASSPVLSRRPRSAAYAVAGITAGIAALIGFIWWNPAASEPTSTSEPVPTTTVAAVVATPSTTAVPRTSTSVASEPTTTVSAAPDYELQVIPIGGAPSTPVLHSGRVWLVRENEDGSGTLLRVDAASGAVMDTIPVGRYPRGPVATADHVWVFNVGDGTLSQVDAGSASVIATIALTDGVEPIVDVGGLQIEAPIEASGAIWVPLADRSAVARVASDGSVSNVALTVKTVGKLFSDGMDVWAPGDSLCFSSQTERVNEQFADVPIHTTCSTFTRINGASGEVVEPVLVSSDEEAYVYGRNDLIPVVECQVENPSVCRRADRRAGDLYEIERDADLERMRSAPNSLDTRGLHPGLVDPAGVVWYPTGMFHYGFSSLLRWDESSIRGQYFCGGDASGHHRGAVTDDVLWLTVPEDGWVCAMGLPAQPSDFVCNADGEGCVQYELNTLWYQSLQPPLEYEDATEPIPTGSGDSVWVSHPSAGTITLVSFDPMSGPTETLSIEVGVGAMAPLVADDGTVWVPSGGRLTALRPSN